MKNVKEIVSDGVCERLYKQCQSRVLYHISDHVRYHVYERVQDYILHHVWDRINNFKGG